MILEHPDAEESVYLLLLNQKCQGNICTTTEKYQFCDDKMKASWAEP